MTDEPSSRADRHASPAERPPRAERQATRAVSIPRLLGRGLTQRCPNCGQGKLFRRWFTMVDRCPRCDLVFDREPGWILGAMTINTAWTFVAMLVTMLAGFVLTWPDIATFEVSLAAGAAAAITPLVGYPFSKTVWVAIDLAMVPLDPARASS